MTWLRNWWRDPRRMRRTVMAVCFVLGLLVGWLAADFWLDRWTGMN